MSETKAAITKHRMDLRCLIRYLRFVSDKIWKPKTLMKIFIVFVATVTMVRLATQSSQHGYTTIMIPHNPNTYSKTTFTKSANGIYDKRRSLRVNVTETVKALDALLSRNYIAALELIRHDIPKTNITENTTKPRRVIVLHESHPEYFKILQDRYSDVRTLFFCENEDIIAQYLAMEYYVGAISDCSLYQLFPEYKAKCTSRPELTETPQSLPTALRRISYPSETSNMTTDSESALRHNFTHIHVIMAASVLPDGDVVKDNLKIIPNRCGINYREKNQMYEPRKNTQRYNEIFTIVQYWGEGFFHFVVENIPRIAAHLPFLLRHSNIKIHVKSTSGFTVRFLAELGIDKSRLVTGHVHADILYLPAGTSCGRASIFNTQLLSLRLRAGLSHQTHPRDTIILIRRSTKRWFNNHNDILAMLRFHADSVGLRTVIYGDDPVLGFKETRELFSRAYMVVAPHGAGESNLIFSQPGTVVVEGLCYDSSGHPNWCYKRLMSVLGHRYYGLLLKKQCMKFKANDVEPIIKYFVSKVRS